MDNSEDLFPGAHVKYKVTTPGIVCVFEKFSCDVSYDKINRIEIEKSQDGNPPNFNILITFYLGPVSSIDEAQTICNEKIEDVLNTLSLTLGIPFSSEGIIGCNVIPKAAKPNEMYLNAIFPAFKGGGTAYSDKKLREEEIKEIIDKLPCLTSYSYTNNKMVLEVFKSALNINNEIAKFMFLYLILMILHGDNKQKQVEEYIKKIEPNVELTPDPRNNDKDETVYTKIRNSITHDRKISPEQILQEITGKALVFKLQKIVQKKLSEVVGNFKACV
ncbi:MAG: hypothetical protein HQL02_05880 [Nitrospirae bacterium]|nr:hypothetical protein [Nitrospirota bacterium]